MLKTAVSNPVSRTLFEAGRSALAAALLALPALAGAQTGPQPELPRTQLSAGIHIIRAEVANTEESRRSGLMFRRELPGNDGMLFVFENPDVQCFWMRNTLLPLSIAFITDDGTIVNIEDMAPQTEDPHCSKSWCATRWKWRRAGTSSTASRPAARSTDCRGARALRASPGAAADRQRLRAARMAVATSA